jgi:magnesium chelatase family protein
LAAGATSNRQVIAKLRSALESLEAAAGVQHPWADREVNYNVVPISTDYHPTLDMALCAATIRNLDDLEALYCGEVDVTGKFAPLAFPLEVGRMAVQAGKPVVAPAQSAGLVASAGADVYAVANIFELALLGKRQRFLHPKQPLSAQANEINPWDDLAYLKGQEKAKWALTVAVAGGHNLLLVGPPGEGKSSLAQRAYTIAPALSFEESLDVTTIWQAAGRLEPTAMMHHRPFIEATKQTTPVALLGGGDAAVGPRPGLVSLAHKGIMLADEFFEWPRSAAECLRSPLQDKRVSLARRDWQCVFPADFQLIATANPCPCGQWGNPHGECRCARYQRKRYLDRISGPIFDRIDIRVQVEPVGDRLLEASNGTPSAVIAEQVAQAVQIQAKRYREAGVGITRNAELGPGMFEALCRETADALDEVIRQGRRLQLSSRGLNKLRGLARTVADLAGAGEVLPCHVAEASGLMEWKPQIEE